MERGDECKALLGGTRWASLRDKILRRPTAKQCEHLWSSREQVAEDQDLVYSERTARRRRGKL